LQPNWTAIGGGGVWAEYWGPLSTDIEVSPGNTAVYDGRQAGIIKAGYTSTGIPNWDQGLLAFQVNSVNISSFASQVLSYVVENQTGTSPVWARIRLVGGIQYQFVPASYGVGGGYHTINAAAGQWQLMDSNGNGIGSLMPLSQVATDNPVAQVDRVYLTLGMGSSYNVSVNPLVGTVGWVDTVTIGGVKYDFVVDTTSSTDKNQCKDNGWKTFNNPTFKNQGDCVSSVEKQKDNGRGNNNQDNNNQGKNDQNNQHGNQRNRHHND
jgi:hypothetical protein